MEDGKSQRGSLDVVPLDGTTNPSNGHKQAQTPRQSLTTIQHNDVESPKEDDGLMKSKSEEQTTTQHH